MNTVTDQPFPRKLESLATGQYCDCYHPAYRQRDGAPVSVRVLDDYPGICVIVEQIDTGRTYPVGRDDLIRWSDCRVAAWIGGSRAGVRIDKTDALADAQEEGAA